MCGPESELENACALLVLGKTSSRDQTKKVQDKKECLRARPEQGRQPQPDVRFPVRRPVLLYKYTTCMVLDGQNANAEQCMEISRRDLPSYRVCTGVDVSRGTIFVALHGTAVSTRSYGTRKYFIKSTSNPAHNQTPQRQQHD